MVRKDSWRKPRGVVNVVSAFGNKKKEKKEAQKHKVPASKQNEVRMKITDERSEGGRAHAQKRSEQSPGILRKQDDRGRRPGTGNSGVRFSSKNEVKLIQVKPDIGGKEGGDQQQQQVTKRGRRTRSTSPGEMRRQSRNILNNMNRKHEAKMRQAAVSGYESESSYHSECGHKSPDRRKRPTGKSGKLVKKRFGESEAKFRQRTARQGEGRRENEADNERRTRSGESPSDPQGSGMSSAKSLSKGMKAKSRGAAKWAKLKLLMLLSRSLNKDGFSSLLLMKHGGDSLKSAAQFAKMSSKFGDLKDEARGSVPRSGGPRPPGSFDTVARYQQHKTPKRFDPLSGIFIHSVQVRWRHYHHRRAFGMPFYLSRDPKGVNSSIRLPWDKVVAEPMDVRAMTSRCSCWFGVVRCNVRAPWDVLHDIFYGVSGCLYKSTCLYVILSAFWFGLYLGVLSFLHIWVVRPLQAMLRMQAIMLRKFIQALVGETIASVMHVLREVFSTRAVDIETLNTDLNGVFLRKQHWPSEVLRRGKVRSRMHWFLNLT